jgi:hypothetical protein
MNVHNYEKIKLSPYLVGCGGLLCDSNGRWIHGYTQKIGTCDAFYVEMWGIYERMKLAQRRWITHFFRESDSKLLIDMIIKRSNLSGATSFWFTEYMILSTWISKLGFSTRDGKATKAQIDKLIIIVCKILLMF